MGALMILMHQRSGTYDDDSRPPCGPLKGASHARRREKTHMTSSPTRIALTTPLLSVPPTYFVTEHAEAIQRGPDSDRHRFHLFPLACSIQPCEISIGSSPAVTWPQNYALQKRIASLGIAQQARLVAASQPDIIHQHHGVWTAGAVWASRRTGAPLVTTFHGTDARTAALANPRGLQRVHQQQARSAFAHSSRILTVSSYLRSIAIIAGAPADRTDVHYLGVDTDFFTPADEARADRAPRVLYVGGLIALKRVQLLLAASDHLSRTLEHECHIIGAGPLSASLQHEFAGSAHVRWRGAMDRAAVRRELQQADVLVLLSDGEAAGLVLVEAQACGVPVVATRGDGKEEMLIDGLTGTLVSQNPEPADVSAAIAGWLQRTASQRASDSAAAREFAVTQRSLTAGAARLAEIYNQVLAERS